MRTICQLIGPGAGLAADIGAATAALRAQGHASINAFQVMRLLTAWPRAAASMPLLFDSWHRLERDHHMGDGGTYRRRRHATLRWLHGRNDILLEPHRPHYQSRAYNALNGGAPRLFEPVGEAELAAPAFHAIVDLCCSVISGLAERGEWRIEVHQFRIDAEGQRCASPTPEGMHRDGVDFVAMMLIDRVNVDGGLTTVKSRDGRVLACRVLDTPLEMMLLDDYQVRHGVAPIVARQPGPAYRDMLVLTFQNLDGSA